MGSTDLNQPSNGLEAPAKLWEHPDAHGTEMYRFMRHINQKYSKDFESYDQLYAWSIESISDFWGEVWHYTGVIGTEFENVTIPSDLRADVDYPRLSMERPPCFHDLAFSRG